MPKSFVTPDRKATFICPKCKKPRRADVSALSDLNQPVRVRVRCPCGNVYTADLERRLRQRKQVNFPGIAVRSTQSDDSGHIPVSVTDISRGGLKLRLSNSGTFKRGEKLRVEFRLDDARRSLICKKVVVAMVNGLEAGVQFIDINGDDSSDKALGFYLL
jgi:RNase P subunit RPR2